MSLERLDGRSGIDGLVLLALGTVTVVTVLAAMTLTMAGVIGW